MSGPNKRSSKSVASGRLSGDHHDLRVAVESPRVEVDGAEADDVVGDHDLGVDDRARQLPHLGARRDQIAVPVPERRGRLAVVRLLGDDDPDVHSAPCGREDSLDHVAVGEVRVHHVEAGTRSVDLLANRLRRGDEAARDDLGEGDRRRAGFRRRREVPGEIGRQRAVVAVEARQEGRLRLSHDGAGDAHHHVVEAAVLEVVLEACSAGPRDPSVDDEQLPMVGAADLVLAPVEVLVVGEEAVSVDRKLVVDDDLRSRRGQAGEHLARLLVGARSVSVDDHAYLHAVCQLLLQQCGHPPSHLAFAPAEHEDVHRRACSLDVGGDAGEEVRAFDPGIDRGRRRPREVERRVVGTRIVAGNERLRRVLSARRGHRVGGRRPARPLRDPERLPVQTDEQRRRHQRDDREGLAAAPAQPPRVSVAGHWRRTLHSSIVGQP